MENSNIGNKNTPAGRVRSKKEVLDYVRANLRENAGSRGTLRELEESLDNMRRMNALSENLVFDDEEEKPRPEPEGGIPEDTPLDEPGMEGRGEPAAASNDIDEKIAAIRKSALEIVSALADNVDDPNYELAKKIWMMCDKKNADAKKGTEAGE